VSDPVVVLDSGVVDQVVTDQEFRWLLRDLVEGGWVPVIPTVVLAEATIGRPTDAPVNQAVKRIGPIDTTPPTARLAGRLRYDVQRSGAHRIPGGIDAIVAAHAVEVGAGVVFTTDPGDLRRLLAGISGVVVDKPGHTGLPAREIAGRGQYRSPTGDHGEWSWGESNPPAPISEVAGQEL
jgi:hypothetical protein